MSQYRILKERRKYQALIKLKGGDIPTDMDRLFERVYWKSPLLARIGLEFWRGVAKAGYEGIPVNFHREWRKKHNLSVGTYYRMIRGLVGCGMIYKKHGCWRVSSGFLRELTQMMALYCGESGYVSPFFQVEQRKGKTLLPSFDSED